MRVQQEAERKRQRIQLKEDQLATQCYSSWEIDETITALIASSAVKWECSKSAAKQKLAASLWASDRSIDDQLERVRRTLHRGATGADAEESTLDDADLYDIKMNI